MLKIENHALYFSISEETLRFDNLVKQVPFTSPDHDCFFLWGLPKNLVVHIPEDIASVREIPGIFECLRQLLHRFGQACITTGGRNFEQLL